MAIQKHNVYNQGYVQSDDENWNNYMDRLREEWDDNNSKFSAEPNQKGRWSGKKKNSYVSIMETFNNLYQKVESPFSIEVSHVYSYMVSWLLENEGKEHSGYFSLNEDNVVQYATLANVGTEGYVETPHESVASQVILFMEEGFPLNGQYHTHPTFSPWWSSTDITDQVNIVEKMLRPTQAEGEFTFIVHNSTGWTARRFNWNTEKCWYTDGTVTLHGVPLNQQTTSISINARGVYKGTYAKGRKSHYVEVFNPERIASIIAILIDHNRDQLGNMIHLMSDTEKVQVAVCLSEDYSLDYLSEFLTRVNEKTSKYKVDRESKVIYYDDDSFF